MANESRYYLESNFVGVSGLFVLVYLNRNDLKLEGITYWKI